MSLVKLRGTKGPEIYVNPDHIAIVAPLTIVGQSGLTLPTGITIEIDEPAREVAKKFGWAEQILSE